MLFDGFNLKPFETTIFWHSVESFGVHSRGFFAKQLNIPSKSNNCPSLSGTVWKCCTEFNSNKYTNWMNKLKSDSKSIQWESLCDMNSTRGINCAEPCFLIEHYGHYYTRNHRTHHFVPMEMCCPSSFQCLNVCVCTVCVTPFSMPSNTQHRTQHNIAQYNTAYRAVNAMIEPQM